MLLDELNQGPQKGARWKEDKKRPSPDFNPIEQSFYTIKAWHQRHEAEAVNPDICPWPVHQASSSVTPEMAQGWVENCGYEFVL